MNESSRSHPDMHDVHPRVTALLKEIDVVSPFTVEPLCGGRNNRAYRLRTNAGDYLLKWYFSHQGDPRDRLGTEFAFCRCLWRHGVRQIARPWCLDQSAGLGLYEFLAGRPPQPADITIERQHQANSFLESVNSARSNADAQDLPNASEACFSFREHLDRIGQRLENLTKVAANDDLGVDLRNFLDRRLRPAFEHHRRELETWSKRFGIGLADILSNENRLLSPSDFGFHNALIGADDVVRFVDFEYAGWDDPAKLVADFFCQIEVPARAEDFDNFLARVARLTAEPELTIQRARRLFPLYQIKWCCIVLNVFLPSGEARRTFNRPHDVDARRSQQLAIARRLLDRVGCVPGTDG